MASILTSATIDEPGRAYSNDPEEDFDEVRRMVDRAKRGTERVNLRAARRLAVEELARLRWPTPSPKVQALIDADARQKRALFDAEDRWRAQTASGPGRVRRTRKEAAERAKATVAARRGGG